MVGGLGVRVSIRYGCTENNGARIEDACGRAFGGGGCVAPLSWLLEKLRGQTWDEACAHTSDAVLDALCDGDRNGSTPLPAAVVRGAEFAVRALRRALGIAEHGMPANVVGDGLLVCRCIGVGDKRIHRTILEGAHTPDAIGAACGAGTGCGSCRPDLRTLLYESTVNDEAVPDAALHPAARIALARAGPMMRALGLPLLSARVADDIVFIRTGESAPDALLSERSAASVVRQVLRDTVCEDVVVVHE